MKPKIWSFFGLLFLMSLPFWLFGALIGGELLPGLPVSAVMALMPVVAAGMLVVRAEGGSGLKSFLGGAVDFRRMAPWAWVVALGTMPTVMLLSAVYQMSVGVDLPAFQFSLGQTAILFAVFFIAATTEELGWTGYAARHLVPARGWIVAGLIIGVVAVIWHVIPLLQAGRGWDWIAWWAVGTAARRMIILWLYTRGGGSVFATSLFHAMSNLSWMLFPVMGSHYDPMSTAVILILFTALTLIIDARWFRNNVPDIS